MSYEYVRGTVPTVGFWPLVIAHLDFGYPINIIFIEIQLPAIIRGVDCSNKTFTQLIVKNALFDIRIFNE